MRKKISFKDFDPTLFLAPILIFFIGILSLTSASSRAGDFMEQALVIKQILWMAVGILLVFLMIRIDYFKLQDLAWPLYFLSVLLLIAVYLMPARLGAHRWIQMGGFNFQPSEFSKFACIFTLSHYFSSHRFGVGSRFYSFVPFAIVGVPFFLILKEPDLGTALLLIPVLLTMLYCWGVKKRFLLGIIFLGILVSPFLFQFLKEYQKTRLLVFVNPNIDPLGAGYTIIQSKIAIGSGGLFGKGFMGGTQNQLNFIPERHTDFIFAVIAEEGGLLASMLIIGLFWLIVRKGFSICSSTSDWFGRMLTCGFSTLIACQIIMNLGMTMGLLPVVGVPLPLVSYGGSSIVMTMLSIALLLNVRLHRPIF